MAEHTRKAKVLAGLASLSVVALAAAGCGSGSSGGSGGNDSKGPVTFVIGKDNSGVWAPTIARWNKAHPKEKVTLKEQSDKADQQHDDIVQHMQAKDAGYDLVTTDVIWTAEFAAKGWLQPLTGKYALPTDGLLEPTVKSATYNKTLYAAPFASDAGLLYYRTDLVKTPPKTLEEMWSDCKIAKQHKISCYAGQFAKYEGLTVNISEAINTYNGQIVDDKGKPIIDNAEAKKGLQMLVDHMKNGDIPKQESTYQEEQGRQAFEDGTFLFMRNWPYAYNLAKTDGSSKVKDKFAVAPLPGVDGPGASSLGGHNIAISKYSDHKQTALDFLKFVEATEQQKFFMQKGSLAPVLSSIYSDADLVKQAPYLPDLHTAIENAVPRPVTPYYPAFSTAIQDNGFAALWSGKAVDPAIADMQKAMEARTSGS